MLPKIIMHIDRVEKIHLSISILKSKPILISLIRSFIKFIMYLDDIVLLDI